ncbi:ABC transporter ATP-binding protein [uncultured Alteromonas sp.]|jgi:ABC-type multidrug transport system ATPase subunit|uniref:ABC transporter ATP-binding protein n=1 Tax=uncultured Alteromonas sp. TaxID=179113 RepID=UPI0025E58E7A|nr:ABC transporter ATP-binding protein [uncultured Alteromonas sp.]
MLTMNQVSKTYSDGTKALDNISLTLPSGMVGLLGPNGAGKSSLMRTVACLQAPDSGQITFNNTDVQQSPQRLREQLGYLPQSFGVYPHMSCLALLHHIAALKHIPRVQAAQQIEELLTLTNLTEFAKKRVSTFSGGMRQRFGIAQALLGDPKLLIMDEPTAGLDPQERQRLHSVLIRLSQHKLVLLSTHIVEDIEHLCPHAAIMMQGAIVDSGAMPALIAPMLNNVWETPAKPSTGVLLGERYHFGQSVWRVYHHEKPAADARACQAALQDRYFLELANRETN